MEISSLNRRELIDKLTAVYQLSRRYDQAYRDLYIIQQKKLPPEEAKIIPKLQGRFGGGGGVMLSGDIQEEEYEITYKGGAAIGEPRTALPSNPAWDAISPPALKRIFSMAMRWISMRWSPSISRCGWTIFGMTIFSIPSPVTMRWRGKLTSLPLRETSW